MSWRRWLAAAPLAAGFVVLTSLDALARAGGGAHGGGGGGGRGGGGFGGGYGGGFGGYGGGYGGGFFPFPLFFFGGGGFFSLIFLLFVMYALWHMYQRSGISAAPAPAPTWQGAEPPTGPSLPEAKATLQQKDPNFNEQVFLDRAQAIFFTLQKAWMDRNLEPARGFMSDGLYRRWKIQIDQMAAAHKKNILDSLVIRGISVVDMRSDDNFDTINTRIDASCADYEIDEQSGKIVFGSKDEQPFTEYWTFIRSATTRTKAGETAEVEHCPNCGAPLSISESGVCNYCKATVTSGRYGWVLDNITQASEWQGAA